MPSMSTYIPVQRQYPEPPPFDVDNYINTQMREAPLEDIAVLKRNMAQSLYELAQPFMAQGYGTLAALNRGTAAFYAHLDSIADYVAASTGFEKKGLFERLAVLADNNADYWKERAEKVGISFIDEIVSEAVGGFVPGVSQFAMDVGSGFTFPYMAGAAEAYKEGESPFAAGMLEAARTGTLYGLFRMMHPLKQYLRAPAFGTVFGIEGAAAAPEGQKAKEFVKGAAIGAMYSAGSPGGKLGLNEVKQAAKNYIIDLDKAGSFEKLREERGSFSQEPKKRQRKFLKTIEEAKEIDPTVKEQVGEIKPQDYFIKPNEESFGRARAKIEKEGVAESIDYLREQTPKNLEQYAEKGALYQELIAEASKNKDYDRAIELVEMFDKEARAYGQFIQPASVWTKALGPEGFIRWSNKQLASVENKYGWMDTILRRRPKSFRLNKEEQKAVFEKYREIAESEKTDTPIDRADAIFELIDNVVAKKVPPSASELIDAYRYQNMLSGPRTQMRNIGENIFNTFVSNPVDIATKGGIDWIKSAVTGKERENYIREAPQYLKAAVNSIPNAVNAFVETAKLTRTADIGKPELGIQAKTEFERARTRQLPTALTLVQRFMEASDKFNIALISTGEMTRLMKKGVPEAEAHARGVELAEQLLYRGKVDPETLSKGAQAIQSLAATIEQMRQMKAIGPIVKWYVPFLRTPANKAIQMVERSPLGLLRDPRKFTKSSAAKAFMGSVVTSIAAQMALNGETTWSPPSSEEGKRLFYASGRRPYSVKMGEKWVPVWYLGPFALAFGIPMAVKHYFQDEKMALSNDGVDKLLKIVEASAQFVGSQSSTQNIGALFSALHGDIDYTFASQTGFTVQQVIPASGLVRYINTIVDPVYRKPKGFVESIEANLPVLSKNLDAYMESDFKKAMRDPINYFLPYDVGKADKAADYLYKTRVHGEQYDNYIKNFEKKLEEVEK